MALWKSRSLSPEEKVRIVEEETDTKMLENKERGSFVGIEDVNMSDVYSSALDINTNSFMELFNRGEIEQRVMERTGCVDYSCTPWELGDMTLYQRQISYKFSKRVSSSGEIHLRYQVEDAPSKPNGCLGKVSFGAEWLKTTSHQKRISKNIVSQLQDLLKVMFAEAAKEFANSS